MRQRRTPAQIREVLTEIIMQVGMQDALIFLWQAFEGLLRAGDTSEVS